MASELKTFGYHPIIQGVDVMTTETLRGVTVTIEYRHTGEVMGLIIHRPKEGGRMMGNADVCSKCGESRGAIRREKLICWDGYDELGRHSFTTKGEPRD